MDKTEKKIIEKVLKVDNIFKLISNDKKEELIFDKVYQIEPFQKELNERVQLLKDLEKNPEKDKILKAFTGTIRNWEHFIFKSLSNTVDEIKLDPELLENNHTNKEYSNIYFSLKTRSNNKSKTYKSQKKNIKEHQKLTIYYFFQFLLFSYKHLKKGGSCLFMLSIPDAYFVNTLYFLTYLFDEVLIINKFIVFCKSFKKDISQIENINLIIQNNYIFNLKKNNEKEFIKYFKNLSKIDYYYKKNAVYSNEIKEYIYYKFIRDLYIMKTIDPKESNSFKKFLKKIYFDYHKNVNQLNLENENNKKSINSGLFINEIQSFSKIFNKIKNKNNTLN